MNNLYRAAAAAAAAAALDRAHNQHSTTNTLAFNKWKLCQAEHGDSPEQSMCTQPNDIAISVYPYRKALVLEPEKVERIDIRVITCPYYQLFSQREYR